MPADFFIGLVTHPRSHFPQARTEGGLASQLALALSNEGAVVTRGVVDEDLLQPGQIATDKAAVKASIKAELDLERRWREYLSGERAPGKLKVLMAARRLKRTMGLAPPWKRQLAETDPGPTMLRRLANIELAHMHVMEMATASQARWSVILEDDAQADDPRALAQQLIAFTKAAEAAGEPRTMNLSESFTLKQLGIEHLLTRANNEGQPTEWQTFASRKLVTNTVCAVLYQRKFLKDLLDVLNDIPIEPVVPIDFKVNAAYLDEPQRTGECWVCSPAPITQGSGVPSARL